MCLRIYLKNRGHLIFPYGSDQPWDIEQKEVKKKLDNRRMGILSG
jgi:hypothetical protein